MRASRRPHADPIPAAARDALGHAERAGRRTLRLEGQNPPVATQYDARAVTTRVSSHRHWALIAVLSVSALWASSAAVAATRITFYFGLKRPEQQAALLEQQNRGRD